MKPLKTALRGYDLINQPMLNKGTAFTEEERTELSLHGLLPPHIGSLDEQVQRRLTALRALQTDFHRYAFLRELQDTNETLFYALLTRNLEELMPIVYTPTVGEGCQRLSEIWRKPRGVFLSYPNKHRIAEILADPHYDDVRVIVVTDGERILGLGDQGAGGMGISIGKLALYTGCGGIPPEACLPVMLDVGTNNKDRLENPLYVGWRHERITGDAYDDFIETFVAAVENRWPGILLQWEDLAGHNAGRLLTRYRDRLCTFNDDIQSTAAIAAATLLAAISVTGTKLIDQRIVMLGLGSSGRGIAELLIRAMVAEGASEAEAHERFYAVGRHGLLVEGAEGIHPEQQAFVRSGDTVKDWDCKSKTEISLFDIVNNAHPTVLIGTSGLQGAFTEDVVRAMAKHVDRPIIFPLSNPTSKSEAEPQNLLDWTDGKALIGTGSPFPPVTHGGKEIPIDQTNNSYIFPGMGLGILVSGASRVTDQMFMVAGQAVAKLSPTHKDKKARLLPPVGAMREVSYEVALAVAKQAIQDGVAPEADEATLPERIKSYMWEPRYRPYGKTESN
jgi:malate dehydrogenase (oxaloacetate-decarboxylating)